MPGGLKTIRSVSLATLLLLLAGCGEFMTRWDPMAYTVRSGDTLYSIAWRYEMDFRDIAEWNDIKPPYAIYPGQRLIMQPVNRDGTVGGQDRPAMTYEDTASVPEPPLPETSPVEEAEPIRETVNIQRPDYVIVRRDDTLYSIARRAGYSHHQLARWNHLRSPYMLRPGQKLRLTPPSGSLGAHETIAQSSQPATVKSPARSTVSKPRSTGGTQPSPALPSSVNQWHWPVRGRVVSTYRAGDTARKGITISGRTGEPVSAAAAGTVVYSGNGLINYGNLVIIKHSTSFLSAYAHNKTLLVKEGDQVKTGQAIARMGNNGGEKPGLHFEIRHNGKPVDPLKYLPRS